MVESDAFNRLGLKPVLRRVWAKPAERLWPLANEAVANRCFEDLAAPSDALEPHCPTLAGQPELIRGHTLFGWWPQTKPREAISRI